MEQNTDRKNVAGLGFIGRGLGELLELKASFRNRLEYLGHNRDRLSEYVFNKLSQEYRAYLDAVDGEVELGLSEYEIKLAEIRLFSNQLKLLEKSYSEKLEELSLRHSLGEFDHEQYQRMCAENEAKLKRFAGSLEKYKGQKQKLEGFLSGAGSPPGSDGPPRSSLLELESALDRVPSKPVFELPIEKLPDQAEPPLVEEVAEQPVEQPAAIDSAPQPEEPIEELPDQAEPPLVEEESLPEPPEKVVLEREPQTAGTQTPAPVSTEQLPEQPVADDSAEKPFELEVDLPGEAAAVEPLGQDGQAGNDLEALMGGEVSTAQPEPEDQSAATQDTEAGAGAKSGFDLEDVFGSALSTQEQEQQPEPKPDLPPETRQNKPEAVSAPETVAQPEIDQPAGPEQSQAPAAGNIEDELLHDLAVTPPTAPAGDEPAKQQEPPPSPESAETGEGLDLGGIIDQVGVADVPDSEPLPREQSQEPAQQHAQSPEVAREPEQEQEQGEPLVEPVPAATGEEPPDTSQPEELQPPADEPRQEDAGVRDDPSQPEQGGGSLVSQALQRAAREPAGQDGQLGATEVVVADLDDGVELVTGGEAGASEAEVLLTMNQTIDAIKKKTVKCPNCDTMNYAIRWYCENCESTLTAL